MTRRLTPDRLEQITRKQRPSAQLRWFEKHLGVKLPCDMAGPIITESAFESLMTKICGLSPAGPAPRPVVKLNRRTDEKTTS